MMEYLILKNELVAYADEKMNNDTAVTLWNSFCLTFGKISLKHGAKNTFCLGNAPLPTLSPEKDYALCVTTDGVSIVGKDYSGLMHGFFSLLMKIEYDNGSLKIKAGLEESDYKVKNRMIHICVFPENDLHFIKRLVRLAGLCQYTHIVIEFWGMLRYDCLKELAWPHAFTKDEAKEIIQECRNLGIEPIPMFNQLGHASASRLCYGKHVVLDQNPSLQRLFTPDGWAWDICSKEVFSLLKQVRKELYELFGDGEYIHLGCDEAYYITRNDTLRKKLPCYLRDLTNEAVAEGRRPMLWMDMLLEEGRFKDCYSVGKRDEVDFLRSSTAKSTVFIDWQYDCTETPIPSLFSLKDSGHDLMGAPWFAVKNYKAHIDTVIRNNMFGVMLTTWHTLKNNMVSVLEFAKMCGAKTFVWSNYSKSHEETATLLRRVSFGNGSYEDYGWAKRQIDT